MKGLSPLSPLSGRIVNNIIGGGIRVDRRSRNNKQYTKAELKEHFNDAVLIILGAIDDKSITMREGKKLIADLKKEIQEMRQMKTSD